MQALRAVLRDLESAPVILLFATDSHPPRAELDALRTRLGNTVRGRCRSVGLPRILRPAHAWPGECCRGSAMSRSSG